MIDWLREKAAAIVLSATGTLTFLQLMAPSWLDFVFNLMIFALVSMLAALHRRRGT